MAPNIVLESIKTIQKMRESISALNSYSSCIKQEALNIDEALFSDRFIQVMVKAQEHMITKDLVLELMTLFYQNNTIFLELFERSFLLIFKTYGNQGARFNKYESQSIIENYSQFLKLFLIEMINMELQVKKTTQEEEYFENFVDFYLTFFAQALTSPKSFIKDFSFAILSVSFKIIDEILDVELLPQTQNQLIQSCIYLLASNFDEYKKMGVQLYVILKKIQINSIQVEELLFKIIESVQNFELRKVIILQGITVNDQQKIDRLLNRLIDRNPLIVETVIQKLITDKIKFQSLLFNQRNKILIDGIGSHHIKVKQKSFQFLALSFQRFLRSNIIEYKSINQNDEDQQESGIQKFMSHFNFDQNSTKISKSLWINNSTIIQEVGLQAVTQLCFHTDLKIIQEQIKRLFKSMEALTISYRESAFLQYLLNKISSIQQKYDSSIMENVYGNRIELKKFINSADFLPSFASIINKIKSKLKHDVFWEEMNKFSVIMRIIQVLIKGFDITDQVGKQNVQKQLRKFIIDFKYKTQNFINRKQENDQTNKDCQKMRFLQSQLRKLNTLLYKKDNSNKKLALSTINHPLDILSISIQVMVNLSSSNHNRKDSILELKMYINELLDNKQLALEYEINTKILINTCNQISKAQSGCLQTKPLQHLIGIKVQLQKRLIQNKRKCNSNITKAFTILTRVLCYQQQIEGIDQTSKLVKASQYIELIKNYLYNNQQQQSQSTIININKNLSNKYIAYVLIYHYCLQSVQNYKSFRKLFEYYSFEQDQQITRENTKSMLIKLINLRLLTQLQLKYQLNEDKYKETQISQQRDNNNNNNNSINNRSSFVQIILTKIINYKQEEDNNHQLQLTLYKQILLKILKQSTKEAKNNKYIALLILVGIKQYFHKQSDNNTFIKQLLLTLQYLSQQSSLQLFQSILNTYECVIVYLNTYKLSHMGEISNINSLLTQITPFFNTLFKITPNHQPNPTIDQINLSLIRLSKTLCLLSKTLQITQSFIIIMTFRLKHIFLTLFQHLNSLQQNHNEQNHSQTTIKTQLLIFTKRKIQQFSQFLKLKQNSLQYHKTKEYLLFLSDIQQIDQILQQIISKRLQQKNNNNPYDQQSTDNNSPQENTQHKTIIEKIDLNLIQTYQETFLKQVKQQNQFIDKIIPYIEKTKVVEQLVKTWKSYQQSKQINIKNEQIHKSINLEEQKINQSQQQVQQTYQHTQQTLNQISAIFDRRGRRKNKLPSQNILIDCYQSKASIKKNRYLIIPYQIVQQAEISSKKLKHYHKKHQQRKISLEKYQKSIMTYPKIENQQIQTQ